MVNEDKLEVCRQFRLSYMLILINDFIIVLFLVAPELLFFPFDAMYYLCTQVKKIAIHALRHAVDYIIG